MITTIILAGGLSRRFNLRDKLTYKLEGKTLIEHTVEAASEISDEIVVTVDNSRRLEKYKGILGMHDVTFAVDDSSKERTPMRGIIAGVKASQGDAIIVIPGDAVHIKGETLRQLVEPLKHGFKAVSPIAPNGDVETLFQAVDAGEARVNADLLGRYGWRRADGLLRLSESQLYIAFEDYCQFKTINKPEDLKAADNPPPPLGESYVKAVQKERRISISDVEPDLYWVEKLVEHGEYFLAGVLSMVILGEAVAPGVEAFRREAARYLDAGIIMFVRHALKDALWLQRQV